MDENIKNIIRIGRRGDESDVTALADMVLTLAEKDFRHGYIVRHQQHILYPTQVKIDGYERMRGIPDITISVMLDNRKILVIECKSSGTYLGTQFRVCSLMGC
jgi:hypothetical protein